MGERYLEVEILRGKGYPQEDYELYPCTTQVMVSLLTADAASRLADDQYSSIQDKSNAPFYKDTVKFFLSNIDITEACILFWVREHSRQSAPYDLLCGKVLVTFDQLRTKTDFIVPLFTTLSEAELQSNAIVKGAATQNAINVDYPYLHIRSFLNVVKSTDIIDLHADVEINEAKTITGKDILVPKNCPYVWYHLLTDKKWRESFRYHLVITWRDQNPLVTTPENNVKNTKLAENRKPKDTCLIRSIGDVITKKWCCRRIHEILTRIRFTAEKFYHGDTNLLFTKLDEVNFRAEKKTRGSLLRFSWYNSFTTKTLGYMRDWLDRLWVLYAIGLDRDFSSGKNLSYEARQKIQETAFDKDDAVVLLSSLLIFLIPSLSYKNVQEIVMEDVNTNTTFKGFMSDIASSPNFDSSEKNSQKIFIGVLLSFIGPLMDTLTETESIKALEMFKPAVADAYQRLKDGVKKTFPSTQSREGHFSWNGIKGEGILIEHLDKFGHRKEPSKYI